MTTARGHNPARPLSDLDALRSAFSIEVARDIVERAVGIPILLDEDFFHPDVNATPDKMQFAQLAFRLGEVVWYWAWDERRQTSASPPMKAELAAKVEGRCASLLAAMTDENGNLYESLGGGGLWAAAALDGEESGRDAVQEAIDGIEAISRWANSMAKREGALPVGKRTRRKDAAFASLIDRLAGIYWQFWRRPPGLSRPDQVKPGGPFFRFVTAVLEEAGIQKTEEALATAITRNSTVKAFAAMSK